MHFSPALLHIPDGFLSIGVSAAFWLASVFMIILATRSTENALGERQIPMMGIMAAFIFAAQMINFPVAGGTSGHFLGGALAAIVLGPWAGILVLTAVIALQGLLFQDGGLLVMGANIFNMGILTALIGFGLYRSVLGHNRTTRLAMAGIAAWVSTVASALLASLQLWLSGTSRLELVLPAMLGVHILIGLGEAAITIAALGLIERVRPDLASSQASAGGRWWIAAGFIAAAGVVFLAPYASTHPDGLNAVAQQLGFFGQGQANPLDLLPNYKIPLLGEQKASTIVAGLLGVAILAGGFLLASKLKGKK